MSVVEDMANYIGHLVCRATWSFVPQCQTGQLAEVAYGVAALLILFLGIAKFLNWIAK